MCMHLALYLSMCCDLCTWLSLSLQEFSLQLLSEPLVGVDCFLQALTQRSNLLQVLH